VCIASRHSRGRYCVAGICFYGDWRAVEDFGVHGDLSLPSSEEQAAAERCDRGVGVWASHLAKAVSRNLALHEKHHEVRGD
jgi:hypothetical protein